MQMGSKENIKIINIILMINKWIIIKLIKILCNNNSKWIQNVLHLQQFILILQFHILDKIFQKVEHLLQQSILSDQKETVREDKYIWKTHRHKMMFKIVRMYNKNKLIKFLKLLSKWIKHSNFLDLGKVIWWTK